MIKFIKFSTEYWELGCSICGEDFDDCICDEGVDW